MTHMQRRGITKAIQAYLYAKESHRAPEQARALLPHSMDTQFSIAGTLHRWMPCIALRPKYNEGVIRCQSSLGEWFCASQRGVKSLKNQLYGFVSLSCLSEVMGPNRVQQQGGLSLCLIGKSMPCEHVALHNSFAILRPHIGWHC